MTTLKDANAARTKLRQAVVAWLGDEDRHYNELRHLNQINGYPTYAIAHFRRKEMELLTGVAHIVRPMDRPFDIGWSVQSEKPVTAESIAREAEDEDGRDNAALINRAYREVYASSFDRVAERAIQRAYREMSRCEEPCQGLPYALQIEAEASKLVND